jgi:molecular chaperone GrpE
MDEKETKRGFGDGAGDDADESPEANAVAEDSERIEADVSKLAADLGELQRMLVRRQADFDNYRKRIERERSDDSRRAMARVIEGLIPVLDGFEQALAAHNEPAYEGFRKGFELIYKQMLDNLTKLGLERFDPSGERFDPHFHQAVDRLETREHPDGTILQVFQPGYVFHGRVLRPALVRVAVHKEGSARSQVN